MTTRSHSSKDTSARRNKFREHLEKRKSTHVDITIKPHNSSRHNKCFQHPARFISWTKADINPTEWRKPTSATTSQSKPRRNQRRKISINWKRFGQTATHHGNGNKTISIIQANLGRNQSATAALNQLIAETKTDIALISEPYINRFGQIGIKGAKTQSKPDATGQRWAAIVTVNQDVNIITLVNDSTPDNLHDNYAAVILTTKEARILIVSIYLPPIQRGYQKPRGQQGKNAANTRRHLQIEETTHQQYDSCR